MDQFLAAPLLLRTRRNHGLEHATIHMLSSAYPHTPMAGRSDGGGFFLYGRLPTEAIEAASHQALERLRSGEHQLALHPNCGTNLLTSGLMAATVAFFALLGLGQTRWRDRLERLPLAIFATTLALVAAQPVGFAAQRYITTQGDPGSLQITRVHQLRGGSVPLHRVSTTG